MLHPQSGTPAIVRPLGTNQSPGLEATIVTVEGSCLRLVCAATLIPGTAIRVDAGEDLFLGEIAEADGRGAVTMVVDQAISCVPDLARLMRSICGDVPDGGISRRLPREAQPAATL